MDYSTAEHFLANRRDPRLMAITTESNGPRCFLTRSRTITKQQLPHLVIGASAVHLTSDEEFCRGVVHGSSPLVLPNTSSQTRIWPTGRA